MGRDVEDARSLRTLDQGLRRRGADEDSRIREQAMDGLGFLRGTWQRRERRTAVTGFSLKRRIGDDERRFSRGLTIREAEQITPAGQVRQLESLDQKLILRVGERRERD